MQNFEYECRAMITFEQYKDMLDFLFQKYPTSTSIINLSNDYFDTDNLDLLENGIVLRVRTSNKGMMLTAKMPLLDKSGDIEISQILSFEEYEKFKQGTLPLGEVKDELVKMGVYKDNIKYQTTLFCKRYEALDGEFIIVLDENNYENIKDYNIEVEASSLENAYKKILELSRIFNFQLKDSYLPKSRRNLLKKFNRL